MGLWDRVTKAIALNPLMTDAAIVHERAIDSFVDHPDMQTQLEMIFRGRSRAGSPWRAASIKEALGVPAIFRSVSLISTVTGSLSMEAYRNGAKLSDARRPRVIVRPNPRTTPRNFFRDTAYYLASRGEVWWYVARRDTDGAALSIVVVPPWEVTVTRNDKDRLRPTVEWLGQDWSSDDRRADLRQITYLPDEDGLRGVGPLQMCNAAVSVAVEAQEWAANFYAYGGYPSVWIKAAGSLSGDPDDDPDEDGIHDGLSEIQRLKAQWIETAPNTPKITDEGIEDIKQFDPNPESAGMLSARDYQNGDAARMFGIPGPLLEFSASGSSLTYQNRTDLWSDFKDSCLAPGYLEPIEHEMNDLLTRSTTARFNVAGLTRADAKTRAEIYSLLVPLNIITPEQAAAQEGYLPGDVEFAPVPFSPPQALPAPIPLQTRSLDELRCPKCHRKVGEVGGPARIQCPRCSSIVVAA